MIIMVLRQALGKEDQNPSLLYPNQLLVNGTTVNDVQRILPGVEFVNPHSLYVPE